MLPPIVASSVIRSAHAGESHGGVYLVDLESGSCEQVIEWSDGTINWEGRGGDRGLRGIAASGDQLYMAASDEVFVYDKCFSPIESHRNRYLKHCHEIFVSGDRLFLTSTGFDSVLVFDLRTRSFTQGYCLRHGKTHRVMRRLGIRIKPAFFVYDPLSEDGPLPGDTTHINSVHHAHGHLFVSGVGLGNLLCCRDRQLFRYAKIPFGSHNAQPYMEGVLLNDTSRDRIVYMSRKGRVLQSFRIKHYEEADLLMSGLPEDHARQGFGRGLAAAHDGLIVGGSSPATVSVYQLGGPETALKEVNITMDVRNSLHGLEIWPY